MDTREELREAAYLEPTELWLDSLTWQQKGDEIERHDLNEEFLSNLIELSGLRPDGVVPTKASIDIFSENISTTVWKDATNKTVKENKHKFAEVTV